MSNHPIDDQVNPVSNRPHSIDFSNEPIMTKQSSQQECDINYILKNFRKTGQLAHLNPTIGTYGDFDNATSYLEAQTMLIEADAAFLALPAEIRDRMNNDPAELLEFLHDPENYEEAVELGLLTKPVPEPGVTADPDPSAPPPEEPEGPPTPPQPGA